MQDRDVLLPRDRVEQHHGATVRRHDHAPAVGRGHRTPGAEHARGRPSRRSGPGLVSTTRSRRPGWAPPARSQASAAAGPQAAVTRPRPSPAPVRDRCSATAPGARAPVAVQDRGLGGADVGGDHLAAVAAAAGQRRPRAPAPGSAEKASVPPPAAGTPAGSAAAGGAARRAGRPARGRRRPGQPGDAEVLRAGADGVPRVSATDGRAGAHRRPRGRTRPATGQLGRTGDQARADGGDGKGAQQASHDALLERRRPNGRARKARPAPAGHAWPRRHHGQVVGGRRSRSRAGGRRAPRRSAGCDPVRRVELPAGVADVGVPDPAPRLGDDEQPAGRTGGQGARRCGRGRRTRQRAAAAAPCGVSSRARADGTVAPAARPLPGKHPPQHQVALVTQPDEPGRRVQPQQAVRVGPALERHEADAEVGQAGAGQVGVRGGPGGDRGLDGGLQRRVAAGRPGQRAHDRARLAADDAVAHRGAVAGQDEHAARPAVRSPGRRRPRGRRPAAVAGRPDVPATRRPRPSRARPAPRRRPGRPASTRRAVQPDGRRRESPSRPSSAANSRHSAHRSRPVPGHGGDLERRRGVGGEDEVRGEQAEGQAGQPQYGQRRSSSRTPGPCAASPPGRRAAPAPTAAASRRRRRRGAAAPAARAGGGVLPRTREAGTGEQDPPVVPRRRSATGPSRSGGTTARTAARTRSARGPRTSRTSAAEHGKHQQGWAEGAEDGDGERGRSGAGRAGPPRRDAEVAREDQGQQQVRHDGAEASGADGGGQRRQRSPRQGGPRPGPPGGGDGPAADVGAGGRQRHGGQQQPGDRDRGGRTGWVDERGAGDQPGEAGEHREVGRRLPARRRGPARAIRPRRRATARRRRRSGRRARRRPGPGEPSGRPRRAGRANRRPPRRGWPARPGGRGGAPPGRATSAEGW